MATPASLTSSDAYTATAYALATDAAEKQAVAVRAKTGLEDGTLKLSSIVLSMQNLVFDQSDPEKYSGEAMSYLVAILKELRKDVLSRTDISLLTKFLQTNVQNDPARFKQTCQALQSLSAMTRFTSKSASDLVSMIYNDSGDTFSTQPVTARFETYKLLNQLLNSHRKVIRAMGSDFIRIIDSLAATERDPRNLMLVFTMIEVILNEWDQEAITETSEELYETLQRYFPISFRPKPNDPVTITANDLILKLRGCFAAYSGFAPSLFPDLIQRLDDPNRLNAKDDVLETMAACIERYEPAVAAQWSSKLWEALKYEIFNSSDDSKAPNAMRVLTVIANRLSLGHTLQTIEGSPLQTYIYLVTTECLTRIREEGQKSSKSAGKVLARIASGSPFSYHLVVRATFPVLLSQFEKDDTVISDKQSALEVINQLLDFRVNVGTMEDRTLRAAFLAVEKDSAAADKLSAAGGSVGVANGGLLLYRDRLTSAFVSVARDPMPGEVQYQVTAMQGLSKLMRVHDFLEDADFNSHAEYFASVIADSPLNHDDVQKEATKALKQLAETHSLVAKRCLPILFRNLPESHPSTDKRAACMSIFHAASEIYAGSFDFMDLAYVLMEMLSKVMKTNPDQTYTHWVLAGILDALLQREKQDLDENTKENVAVELKHIIRELLEAFFTIRPAQDGLCDIIPENHHVGGIRVEPDNQSTQLVGEIVMVAMRSGENLLLEESETPVVQGFFAIPEGDSEHTPRLFDFTDSSSDRLPALTVVSYILAALPRLHKLGLNPDQTTAKLASFLAYGDSPIVPTPTQRSSLLNLLAVLVNKHSHLLPPSDKDAGENLIRTLLAPISESEVSESSIKNVIQVYATITQAANLAGNKHTTTLLNGLLDRIELGDSTGTWFAQAFDAILSPSDILIPQNNALIRGLYKQRLFSLCVPKILDKFAQTQDQQLKSNYLIALGGILKNVPGDMIMPYIDRLLPFLLQSVEAGSESVKAVSIDVLRIASIESPDAVEGHVSGIVKRLLACLEEDPAQKGGYRCKPATRCKALVALGVLPKSLRMSVVLPCKKEVLGRLRESGEDKSRRVREKVVDCQMVWWKLAGVEEEE